MKKSANKTENQVLYRKYRPTTWSEVVGEEHVVSVLESQVKLGTLSHAYLFSGSRGTGKTSVARILAREVGTTSNDLYEIDAASNTGVDDVRALTEAVHTLPLESKYKVYILDEAHMLSKNAWNALLKTLEEPPKHVIFILATTELEKVPVTVRSRCTTFVFREPSRATLRDFALNIAKQEGRVLAPEAAELVALLGDGSFRDAHGILEKVFSSTEEKKVSRAEIERVTGAPKSQLVENILEAVVHKDLPKGLEAVKAAKESNVEMRLFARLILERMRYLFLLRLKAGEDESIKQEAGGDEYQTLKHLAAEADKTLTAQTLLHFIKAYEDAGRSALPELPLELALVEAIGQS